MERELDFRMEREGLVKEGDKVELKEDIVSTMSGVVYYYTIKNAVAMSKNIKERVHVLSGIVRKVVDDEGIFTVTVKIDEIA
jgi:hypothetical protein